MLKTYLSSVQRVELCLLSEILISKNALQSQKTIASFIEVNYRASELVLQGHRVISCWKNVKCFCFASMHVTVWKSYIFCTFLLVICSSGAPNRILTSDRNYSQGSSLFEFLISKQKKIWKVLGLLNFYLDFEAFESCQKRLDRFSIDSPK